MREIPFFSYFLKICAVTLNFWKIPTGFFRVDIYDTFYRGYDILANRFQLQNVGFKKKSWKMRYFFRKMNCNFSVSLYKSILMAAFKRWDSKHLEMLLLIFFLGRIQWIDMTLKVDKKYDLLVQKGLKLKIY